MGTMIRINICVLLLGCAAFPMASCGGGDDSQQPSVEGEVDSTDIDLTAKDIAQVVFLADPKDPSPFPSTPSSCTVYRVPTDKGWVVSIWPSDVDDESSLQPLPSSDGARLIKELASDGDVSEEVADREKSDLWQSFVDTCRNTYDASTDWCVAAWEWTSRNAEEIWQWIRKQFDKHVENSIAYFAPVISSTVLAERATPYLESLLAQIGVAEEPAQTVSRFLKLICQMPALLIERAAGDIWDTGKLIYKAVANPAATFQAIVDSVEAAYTLITLAPHLTGDQWAQMLELGLDSVVQEFGHTELSAHDLVYILTGGEASYELWQEACVTTVYSVCKLISVVVVGGVAGKYASELLAKMKAVGNGTSRHHTPAVPVWTASNRGSATEKLKRNLRDAGQLPFTADDHAHHVIALTDGRYTAAIELREMAAKYEFDLNSRDNGVWLPPRPSKRSVGDTRVAHLGEGVHQEFYHQTVLRKAERAVQRAGLQGEDPKEAFARAVRGIGESLRDRDSWERAVAYD